MGRPHPALVDLAAGRQLPSIRDHAELLRSAIEHRMTGLLWSHVHEIADGTPTGWSTALAHEDLQTRFFNRALWSTLETTVAGLAQADIGVVATKGVTAEARWYDRLGERPCGDLDLWIDPAQLHRADDVLAVVQPDHPLRSQLARLATSGALSSVELRAGDGTPIDLHFDLLKLGFRSRLGPTAWDRSVEVVGPSGETVKVLDPEIALVLFLVHLNKDRFRSLLGFVDVARLLDREQLDWPTVLDLARADGVETHVQMSLTAVASQLTLPVPLPPAHGARAAAWHVLWRPPIRLRGDEGLARFRFRQVALALLARGHVREGLRYAARRAFPRKELLQYTRPDGRGPYLWRLTAGRLKARQQRRRAALEPPPIAAQDARRAVAPIPGND
jgi:hypothetical protein